MKREIVELLGTFFLVLTIGLTTNPLAIAAVLVVMIYAGGYVSGAHFNPAVSFAMWLQKELSTDDFLSYLASQFLGGVLACLSVMFFLGEKMKVTPGDGVNLSTALFAETLFTFLLVFVVLSVVLNKRIAGNQYFGLAIGLAVLVGVICIGPISGGALNPAVGLSPLLLDLRHLYSTYPYAFLYLFGPMLGGFFASVLYSYLNGK